MPGPAKDVTLNGQSTDMVKLLRAILYAICIVAGISVQDALNGGNAEL